MKPQQLLNAAHLELDAMKACAMHARSSLPALTAVAVALASSVVLMLGGCASSAGIASNASLVAPASVGLTGDAAAVPAVGADWWHAFGDATLDGLIDRAVAGSPNLRLAQARLARADAAIAGVRSNDGLRVNGEADITRQRFSGNGVFPAPIGGNTFSVGTAQLSASYEFDFFGRNRAAIAAAVGNERAAQADVQAARIMLAGSVARTYVQLGRLFEQRAVAERSLQQRDQILGLINQRVQGGIDTAVEQRQGEGALPETREQIEQLDEQIVLTRHAIAALTAQPPDTFDALTVPLRSVQIVAVPASLPADLLGRRADITAARWRIEAATSDVAASKADFYPNINLTAAFGLSSIGVSQLLRSNSEQYNAGPAIRLPIFDAGRLRANLRGRAADLDAAIESYNGAVLDAVHDAADQIASLRSIERQQVQQVRAQDATESAYDLATQRYKAGIGGYLTVLNAEAAVLVQRRLAADLKARMLDSQIALIRALGGGYVPDAALAARTSTTATATGAR